ncbi:ATP-dependent Clp protease proteolytic subunit-related protein 2, chloroplastic isoform X2 [Selaginella moellendorffii]|uniref:ATP-dependent Clp protease proteolytic subunit-related protein 2, chloroplastic isoform X2 n=1 Tax=Selaginella moellendorffii TaxID=88036 RepID=UPI000D1C8EBB|nr:ATP-dependent Clp protease proteolytic subunit-related protein 2, chloroplastic isoform X2 [Selaginella moellendorffii]|eukprot:XP_024545015.1 ATP-dependent Clp protease proteolytic subunit-related protein 2, chloroplastic isoform X2 [Selaginella moellendorffii]
MAVMNAAASSPCCFNPSSCEKSAALFSSQWRQDESGFCVSRSANARPRRAGICRAQVTMMPIGTPKVPYRTPGEGTWQFVDIWNVLYRERIIFIGQHIDEEFGNQVLATMLYLDSVDSSKDLHFYMSCPGGDLTPSMAIYDTMGSVKSRMGTMALGYAYNIAGFLLAAGEKGMRTSMPLTRIAIQPPQGAARGKAADIQNEAKELSRVRDYLFKQLAVKTGHPEEKIHKDFSRIKRFSAQEALDYGLIDKIIRPPTVKPDASSKGEAGRGIG